MFALVEKDLRISSFTAIAMLRKVFQTKTIGHAGTLDPLATWLLIVATDRSTKLLPYLDDFEKTYAFEVDFSVTSPSLDLGTPTEPISEEALEAGEALMKANLDSTIRTDFTGKILQSPPLYSAINIDGRRAYKIAWSWKSVEIAPREASVHGFEIVDYEFPIVSFRATVSTGTYVRSLARDIGAKFWLGGVVTKLRREKIGPFVSPGKENSPLVLDEREFFVGRTEDITAEECENIKRGILVANRFGRPVGIPFVAVFQDEIVSVLSAREDGLCRIVRNVR